MEQFTRPYTDEEKMILREKRYSFWDRLENFLGRMIAVTLLLIAPLLVYDKYVEEVSSDTQLVILVPLLIIATLIVIFWLKKEGIWNWNKVLEHEIKNGFAKVAKLKADYVVKRKDPEDFGSGYYFNIGSNRTLYLQGQYFDQLQYSRKFPNTDFEIVRSSLHHNELINYTSFGEYLKPEKKIKPFTKEQYNSGDFHCDGDILDLPIEDIL